MGGIYLAIFCLFYTIFQEEKTDINMSVPTYLYVDKSKTLWECNVREKNYKSLGASIFSIKYFYTENYYLLLNTPQAP